MLALLLCPFLQGYLQHHFEDIVIGIDIGTTSARVAVHENGTLTVLKEAVSSSSGTSDLIFHPQAIRGAQVNGSELGFHAPRELGFGIEDWNVGLKQDYATTMKKLKTMAEGHLGKQVKNAAVSVPASFNVEQRQAIYNAGEIAGLNVVRLVNVPYAALVVDCLTHKSDRKLVVFSLGAGLFEACVFQTRGGGLGFTAFATHSDVGISGNKFTDRLVDHILDLFESRTGKSAKTNMEATRKLRQECEKAKCILSSENDTRIEIVNFIEGETLSERITRDLFEQLNGDLFNRTVEIVEKIVKESGFGKCDIAEVIFVGGSTRIPKIRELIGNLFDGQTALEFGNPEMIVSGVAAIGARLSGDPVAEENVIISASFLTLGIKLRGGFMEPVLEMVAELPARRTEVFSTVANNQHAAKIEIYQDCDMMAENDVFLGEFTISGLPPGRHGDVYLHVTFDFDENKALTVIAEDRMSNHMEWITIRGPKLWIARDTCDDIEYVPGTLTSHSKCGHDEGDITDSNRTELWMAMPPGWDPSVACKDDDDEESFDPDSDEDEDEEKGPQVRA
jgi:molecular chaperone DnaK (HSP70)